jgi:hypothetical protein
MNRRCLDVMVIDAEDGNADEDKQLLVIEVTFLCDGIHRPGMFQVFCLFNSHTLPPHCIPVTLPPLMPLPFSVIQ